MPIHQGCVLLVLLPACEAIAILAYPFQCRFISQHSGFWRHLSNATKLTLISTLSKGTDLNVSADPTFPSSVQQTHHLFCWTVYSWQTWNKFFSALENKQLVVIKTEKEAKEENWVTGMSGEKKKLLEYHKRRKKKKNQDCPKFCYRRDMQEVSSKEGKDYIPVLILWHLPVAKGMANPIAYDQK